MTAHAAAVAVADRAQDADDCRQLLDALGLLEHPAPEHEPEPEQDEPKPRKGKPKSPCGTPTAYQNGCRCQPCTRANTERCAHRRKNWPDPAALADRAGHGKLTTYKNYGCRCAPCKQVNTEATRRYRALKRGAA